MSDVVATLIGDVIGSRTSPDRRKLQAALVDALNEVNAIVEPVQPLEPTIGDEFQGAYSDIGQAAHAALLVRLALLERADGADTRFGLGLGTVNIFDDTRSPVSQDGPGWWAARAALERVGDLEDSSRTESVRTGFRDWPDNGAELSELAASVEAFLICRDQLVATMNERGRRLLRWLLEGRTQVEMAKDEGITQGAVSQHLKASGAFGVQAAHRAMLAIHG